jgi:radical SAM superfamily enzyme YgiQ (UPF0313 family)
MNILLVQPRLSILQKSFWKRYTEQAANKFYTPPLTLEQLYAIIPEHNEVTIIDERIGKKIDYDKQYDIVGITAFTAHINRAYEIADKLRKKGTKVVLGGYHPSAIPEEAKQHADSVVLGESEYSWPRLLKDVKNDSLKSFYMADKPVNQEDIPSAKRDQTGDKYFCAAVQASRGCPNRCEFCAISNMKHGAIVRKRPVNNVIEEIKTISQKYLHFYDPSMTSHPAYSKSLFKEMIGLNKKFTCNGNVGTLYKDEELLKLASEAGCAQWYIGFESFSQKNISQIGKKTNKVEEYRPAIKKIRDHGMNIHGHFVFGLDNDGKDVFDTALSSINDLGLTTVEFHVQTPFPGTPLFDRLDREGRIISKDWSRYTLNNVNFKPKLMSEEDLFNGVCKLKERFYSFNNFTQIIHKMEEMSFSSLSYMMKTHFLSKLQLS